MTPFVFAPYVIVFALVGAVVWAAVPEKFPTVREFGKAMMWAGLFAFAFAMSSAHVKIGG